MQSSGTQQNAHGSPEWLLGGGQMGELIRAKDWSRTPLGPRQQWPQSLRSAVSLILPSRFPMAILWGKELISIHNDACAAIAAERFERVMGLV